MNNIPIVTLEIVRLNLQESIRVVEPFQDDNLGKFLTGYLTIIHDYIDGELQSAIENSKTEWLRTISEE
jgi:hypothetical protein